MDIIQSEPTMKHALIACIIGLVLPDLTIASELPKVPPNSSGSLGKPVGKLLAPVVPPTDANELMELVQNNRTAGRHPNADFYLSRYMGMSVLGRAGFNYNRGLAEVLKHPSWKRPTSLISGRYSNDFLKYFTDASFAMWAVAQPVSFDLSSRRVLLRETHDERRYVVIWGRPAFSTWLIMGRKKFEKLVVASSHNINLQFGHMDKGGLPKACGRIDIEGEILWVYQPVFKNVFPGPRKDLILRFNEGIADGYVQFLRIYSFNGKGRGCKPVLAAEFRASKGSARFNGNFIEFAEETGAEGEGIFYRSFHEIKKFQLRDTRFVSVGKNKLIPNFLHSREWEKFLLPN